MPASKRSSQTRRRAPRPKALILAPFSEEYIERLKDGFEVKYESWIENRRLYNPADLAARVRKEKIGVLVVEADFLVRDTFASPSLRITGVCRNGLDLIDLKAATEFGIPVLNTPTRNAVAVAELTVGLMIAATRQIPAAHNYVVAGGWTDPIHPYVTFRGREIFGSTVGIVGLGSIGREVAKRVQALGARVIAYDPFLPKQRAQAIGARLVSLPALLQKADFVSLHTAKSEETESMIDAAALDMMKPEAYIVSIGAGNVIDEDALASALRERKIAGAALDVFHGHFIKPDSPLLGLDNVVLTPHIGGATAETVERQSRMIVEDVERFYRGERPRRVANPAALAHARNGR